MIPPDELRHLRAGAQDGESPGGAGVAVVVARCRGDAQAVDERAREVMTAVLSRLVHGRTGYDTSHWSSVLPAWFVAACAPQQSREDAERWLTWWRSLPADQRAQADRERAWSLADWIYWFDPDERQWFWWDANVAGPDILRVTVELAGWPAPLGALRWLLTAAGAVDVRQAEDAGPVAHG